jgi:hypothetical protein
MPTPFGGSVSKTHELLVHVLSMDHPCSQLALDDILNSLISGNAARTSSILQQELPLFCSALLSIISFLEKTTIQKGIDLTKEINHNQSSATRTKHTDFLGKYKKNI